MAGEKDPSARHELPTILYDMLEDARKAKQEDIVSWMPHGRAFKVHDRHEFETKIMPNYFTEKYDSFRFLLAQWGFLKLSRRGAKDRGGYYHKWFIQGKRHLCENAKKHEFIAAMPDFMPASDEPDLYELAKEEEAKEKSERGAKRSSKRKRKASGEKNESSESGSHSDKPDAPEGQSKNGTKKAPPPQHIDEPHSKSKVGEIRFDFDFESPSKLAVEKEQSLLNLSLCRYYLPPLLLSPRPYSILWNLPENDVRGKMKQGSQMFEVTEPNKHVHQEGEPANEGNKQSSKEQQMSNAKDPIQKEEKPADEEFINKVDIRADEAKKPVQEEEPMQPEPILKEEQLPEETKNPPSLLASENEASA
jgi:hypothetical protein